MSVKLKSAVGERLKFGEFELAPVARTLWRRGKQVKLGSRALDILREQTDLFLHAAQAYGRLDDRPR
jgi:DNA-binding winged helix-turn-helix (wHTH) protein